jgi:hypothetical protein
MSTYYNVAARFNDALEDATHAYWWHIIKMEGPDAQKKLGEAIAMLERNLACREPANHIIAS